MSNTTWYDVTDGGLETLQRSLIPQEAAAKKQRWYSPQILPGLLQTYDYARAVLTECSEVLAHTDNRDDVEKTTLARLERQTVLDMPGHNFHLLIQEAALRLTVGNSEIMAAQVRHLIDILTVREHVKIGIIPLDARFVAPSINFVISDTGDGTVADSEGIHGPIENRESVEVALVERTFDRLAGTAVYGEDAAIILELVLDAHIGSEF